MSATRRTIAYSAIGAAVAVFIILGSAFFVPSLGNGTPTSPGSAKTFAQSQLAVQLTDPPQVPQATQSLNLTYSSVNMLVGEPVSNGQMTTSSISVSPTGGSATVDLLKLQNVSETIASTNIPTGSVIYSIGMTVQSISIDVNGTTSPVTLALGGSTLSLTLARPATVSNDSALLLEFNPVVVNTPTGYQLIPSMVGILRPSSEYQQGDSGLGSQQQVSQVDNQKLSQAVGQASARLLSLSVSGNLTTITVQVNNTGSGPITLTAIGLNGNFTSASGCPSSQSQGDGNGNGNQGQGQATQTGSGKGNDSGGQGYQTGNGGNGGQRSADHRSYDPFSGCHGHNEVVFSPVLPATTSTSSSTSTTSTSSASSSSTAATCSSAQLALNGGDQGYDHPSGMTIAPGACVELTFSGTIAFGNSGAIVPSTGAGESYLVHVIASDNAETVLSCTLPINATSCTTASH